MRLHMISNWQELYVEESFFELSQDICTKYLTKDFVFRSSHMSLINKPNILFPEMKVSISCQSNGKPLECYMSRINKIYPVCIKFDTWWCVLVEWTFVKGKAIFKNLKWKLISIWRPWPFSSVTPYITVMNEIGPDLDSDHSLHTYFIDGIVHKCDGETALKSCFMGAFVSNWKMVFAYSVLHFKYVLESWV